MKVFHHINDFRTDIETETGVIHDTNPGGEISIWKIDETNGLRLNYFNYGMKENKEGSLQIIYADELLLDEWLGEVPSE